MRLKEDTPTLDEFDSMYPDTDYMDHSKDVSVDEEMKTVSTSGTKNNIEKEFKKVVSKALYSGSLSVDNLLSALGDNNYDVLTEVEEYIDEEEPNFNQLTNFVRECAIDFGLELDDLLNEIEYYINTQSKVEKIEVKETQTDTPKNVIQAIDLTIEALKQGVVTWNQIKELTDNLPDDAELFNDYNAARKALITEYYNGNLVISQDELGNI